jgi:nucleotide-binding universal stress UspA family protein
MMKKVLVGYDGSEPASHALGQACRIAGAFGATLTLLTAASGRMVREDGVVTMAADEDTARWTAQQGADWCRQNGNTTLETKVVVDTAGHALVEEAKNGYDLIVVGHKGHGGLQEIFVGSTAKHVVDHVCCSVLVVR